MDRGPLVSEETDAGAELVSEFDKFEPIEAAFWLKASDDPFRYLYIAPKRTETDLRTAYREIVRLTSKMESPYLDPFRVKIVRADHPLVQAAVELNRRFPGRMATRVGGRSFGGISVDEVYVYPTTVAAAVP